MFSNVFFSWIPEFKSPVSCLSLVFLDWGITDVKAWALDKFKCEAIANSFEREEVDGKILLSPTVQSQEAMESLGLKTLGKKATFLDEIHKLTGTRLASRKSLMCCQFFCSRNREGSYSLGFLTKSWNLAGNFWDSENVQNSWVFLQNYKWAL